MSSIKGGKGLHGPDNQQDALRDVRSGPYDKGGPSRAPHPSEGHLPSTSARNRVPMYDRVYQMLKRFVSKTRNLPEGLSRARMGPLDKTPDEVTKLLFEKPATPARLYR